ncbi:GRIK3 [Branchiostoma lanceolatum]|uniref:GRIK3 protein n=1 Tax=Branchiostoma lanceolatum TaxID=7740 RepID=A0A8K0EGK4_BRALA|nr:GRIK3 [Branchiostoma lanceolatum]
MTPVTAASVFIALVFLGGQVSSLPTTTRLPIRISRSSEQGGHSSTSVDTDGDATIDYDDESIKYIKGQVLRAVTKTPAHPFLVLTNKTSGLVYEGYLKDVLSSLARILKFEYEIYESPDGKYGAPDHRGVWNGMVGEVVHGRANLTLAPLTISSLREKVVDFTKPYLHVGTDMMMKTPSEDVDIFSFLMPFEPILWLTILGAVLGVALLLFLTAKARAMAGAGDKSFDNDSAFTGYNSIWFAVWSVLRKGGEPAPRSIPARILAAGLWLFALIVVSTYTANLSAFLTVKRLESPINSLDSLVHNNKVRFGVPRDTFLYSFFESYKDDTGNVYKEAWDRMEADDSYYRNFKDGVGKAKRGDYVMLAETPFLEYAVLNDEKCELMLVGAPFMFQGYGLATKRGDPLRKALSIGILRLQETGALSAIKQRWWPEDKCPLYGGGSAVRGKSRVTITTFLGVFFILAGVASLALIVTVVQVLFAKSPCGKRRYKKREQSKSVLQSTSSLSDSKASAPQFDAAIADGD